MPHFHMGRSEAEGLVRSAPHLAPAMLERARRDLRRWSTRLFQPDKRRFLEGYLSVLGPFVEGGTKSALRGPHLPLERSMNSLAADPIPTPRSPSTRTARAPEVPASEPPLAGLELDEVPASEPPLAISASLEAIPSANLVEAADPVISDQPPEAAQISPAPDSIPRPNLDSLALGVWKISGWSQVEPPTGERRDPKDTSVQTPDAEAAVAPPPLPRADTPIDWSGVFNQMQGTGIVDLTAYDLLDQLGQLRELLDQWNEQNRPLVSSGPSQS